MHNIGIGYSTDKRTITGTSCLKDYKADVIGSVGSSVIFGDATTSRDITKSFAMDMSVTAVFLVIFKGTVSASYAQYIQESRYSQTFNFVYQINMGSRTLNINDYGPNTLNPFGLAAYMAGPQAFREACGDKFIIQQSLGARLFATVKLNFATTADQKSFSAAVGGGVDLLVLTLDIQEKLSVMIEQKNINMNIEIAAYQDGGDVIKLATIFNKVPGGAYYVTSCDISDMKPCIAVVNALINYAKLDFKDQIHYYDDKYSTSLGEVYESYTSIGLNATNSTVTHDISRIRMEMVGNYTLLTQERDFLNNLLYNSAIHQNNDTYKLFDEAPNIDRAVPAYWSWSPDEIFTPIHITLSKTLNSIMSNILLLESDIGIPLCYTNPAACITPSLQRVDYDLINSFKQAFQIIALCNNTAYNGYAFPIDKNVYQEEARFENPEIYFTVRYFIELKNVTTGEIDVSIVTNELTKEAHYCRSMLPKENQDIFLVYEDTFVDYCGNALCPVGASATQMILISIETLI